MCFCPYSAFFASTARSGDALSREFFPSLPRSIKKTQFLRTLVTLLPVLGTFFILFWSYFFLEEAVIPSTNAPVFSPPALLPIQQFFFP